MKKERIYQGVNLSKKEHEWVTWYQQGTNDWWNAFYQYRGRKMKYRSEILLKSWFNSVLKGLKKKGLFNQVPYVFMANEGFYWVHPGFESNGSQEIISVEYDPKLLNYQKPVL